MKLRPLVSAFGLLSACSLLAACGPATAEVVMTTSATSPQPSPGGGAAPQKEATLEEQASRAAARGALDVAAHLAGRIAQRDNTPQARLEYARALLDTWAFERAAPVLAALDEPRVDDAARQKAAALRASLPQNAALKSPAPDPAIVDKALSALAARDFAGARTLLTPLAQPGAPPWLLVLLGRAHMGASDALEARRAFSRARSRIDAAGGRLGLVAAAPASIDHAALDRGRLVTARTRELRLVGGYQAMEDFSKWIEVFAPGDPDPLLRVGTGHIDGIDTRSDPPMAAFVERPLGFTTGRPRAELRVLDLRTGLETSSQPVEAPHLLRLSPGGKELLVGIGSTVRVWDLSGRELRRIELKGKTPGIIRAYTGQGTYHHNIPTEFPSQATHIEQDADGTIMAALTDGRIWLIRPGAGQPTILNPLQGPPADDRAAIASRALELHKRGDELTAVYGSGSIVRWDLRGRKPTELAPGRCSDDELRAWSHDPSLPPDPSQAADCALSSGAVVSPDGSRVLFLSTMSSVRVRSARDGKPITSLSTFLQRAHACADASCSRAWLAGVDGRAELWDTGAARAIEPLAQGGVQMFVRGASPDGRFVVIDTIIEVGGAPAHGRTRVWDTTTGAEVELPGGFEAAMMIDGRPRIAALTKTDALVYDLEARRKVATFPLGDQHFAQLSQDGRRVVTIKDRSATVREGARALRTFEMGGTIYHQSLSRDGGRLCLFDDQGTARVFDVGNGAELYRHSSASSAVLSPDGEHVAVRIDRDTLAVIEIAGPRELGRVTSKELKISPYPAPIGAVAFTGRGAEVVLGGPGAAGYTGVYIWRPGQAPRATDLQVLIPDRIAPGVEGVVHIFDRNDTMHLVRLDDGKLLASVYGARGGGWVAQSARGAVDGPEVARGAFIAFTKGLNQSFGFGASVAWDRFHVPGLLGRAARGELIAPPMPGALRQTETQRAEAK